MASKRFVRCNLCGSDRTKKLYYIDRFKTRFSVVKCKRCGLVYMNPQLSEKEISNLYNEEYYQGTADYSYQDERKHAKAAKIIHDKRLQVIEKYVKKGRMLDIGCSFGIFLDAARQRGWDAYGVELSKHATGYAKKSLRLNVFNGTLERARFRSNFFDVILMAELIEHLPDPAKTLQECNRILKKGGLLVVQTSNEESLYAKLLGKNWDWFLPGHLYYFSVRTLRNMLQKTGFKVKRIYFGDEIGAMVKAKAFFAEKKRVNLRNLIEFIKIVLMQTVRRIHLGEFSIGGIVVYSRKC
jgi:2-polyprenyl-3-methyl-5-hydroxy-6-metoxy-1,4-benzoquinol methylase